MGSAPGVVTREPYRNWVATAGQDSTLGGSTWSSQPPQSSQVIKIAVLGHSPPLTMALTWLTVHCIPWVTLSSGCSLSRWSAYTHDTLGSFPAAASVANCCCGSFCLPARLLMY